MNRGQKIALWVGLTNLAVLLLFPPIDHFSFLDAEQLLFAGFHFIFSRDRNEVINNDLLFLELALLSINLGIAWLLLRWGKDGADRRRSMFQRALLLGVAVNLALILLFPPYQYLSPFAEAVRSTFEGFYFVFTAEPGFSILSPLLYLEIVFVLINGAVLWLLIRRDRDK